MKQSKVIVVGASLSGKTTLIRYLREHTDLPVHEIDEEVERANGGIWPDSIEYKNRVLVPPIVAKVLASDSIIFFTNAFYFSAEDLRLARTKGFKVFQLVAELEVLKQRNVHRVAEEGYDDQNQWLDSMVSYQNEIKDEGLVDVVINTNRPIDVVAHELQSLL